MVSKVKTASWIDHWYKLKEQEAQTLSLTDLFTKRFERALQIS